MINYFPTVIKACAPLLLLGVNSLFSMGGAKDEPKLFTNQPSYRVKVTFKDKTEKILRSIHFNGKPELPNVFLVCRGLDSASKDDACHGIDEGGKHKKRKTSIRAKIEFKNVRTIEFGRFSDTHIKAHVTSKDGTCEEYRIPSDIKIKAETDISMIELDFTRIERIEFIGMSTNRSTLSDEEKAAQKKKLFAATSKKSLEKMKIEEGTKQFGPSVDAASGEATLSSN